MAKAASYNPGAGKHLERALRVKGGYTVAEIAKQDGVSEQAVQKSLRIVNINRARHSDEFLKEEFVRIAMLLGPGTAQAVAGALNATYDVTRTEDGQEIVSQEPDYTTRLQAVDRVVEIAKVALPKGGPSINVGMGVNVNHPTRQATGTYVGMEDRLRDITKNIEHQPLLEGRTVQMTTLEQPQGEFAMVEASDDGPDED
jgi:hypothetical protein